MCKNMKMMIIIILISYYYIKLMTSQNDTQ